MHFVSGRDPMLKGEARPPQSPLKDMKYVVVSGGVLSGLGKGVTASSIGVLLKSAGLRVTAVKIDPYLNSDAGTMSPFEHGEVLFSMMAAKPTSTLETMNASVGLTYTKTTTSPQARSIHR